MIGSASAAYAANANDLTSADGGASTSSLPVANSSGWTKSNNQTPLTWTALDVDVNELLSGDLVDVFGDGTRATMEFNWDIPAGAGRESVQTMSMEAGETIRINGSYTPSSSPVWFGVVTPSGGVDALLIVGGNVDQTYHVSTRGQYKLYIGNASEFPVNAKGFVEF